MNITTTILLFSLIAMLQLPQGTAFHPGALLKRSQRLISPISKAMERHIGVASFLGPRIKDTTARIVKVFLADDSENEETNFPTLAMTAILLVGMAEILIDRESSSLN